MGSTVNDVSEPDSTRRTDDPDPEADEPGAAPAGHVLDLVPGYVLGVLDPDENELVARHVQGCARCRGELARHERVRQLLPYAVPAQSVPLRARAAVLAAIDTVGTTNDQQMIVLPAPAADRRSWLRRHPRALALASVAAMAVLMFGTMLALGERNNQLEEQIAQVEEERDQAERVLMRYPTPVNPTSTIEFVSTAAGGNAQGRLFVDHSLNEAMILVVDLPEPANDEHFVVWLQFYGETEYARAGVLEVDDQNRAQLTVDPVDALARYAAVIITAESDPDAPSPSGPELMTAAIIPSR
jgi:hypothetical protein